MATIFQITLFGQPRFFRYKTPPSNQKTKKPSTKPCRAAQQPKNHLQNPAGQPSSQKTCYKTTPSNPASKKPATNPCRATQQAKNLLQIPAGQPGDKKAGKRVYPQKK